MATLGDAFPSDFKEEFSQARGISPGDVLYLWCDFTDPAKLKFLVVVCCNPLLVLVVNSKIHQFILDRPHLLECQVDLPLDDHDFLKHDSHVDCVEAHQAFSLNEVKDAIAADYGAVLKGRVLDVYMREIYIAVEKSKGIPLRHKKKILAEMAQYQ
ncbi:hypothetical protein WAA39_002332 [Enterobacter mori]|jgi:hypothetical protein|uniref:hypothetical protein n=1 Tax=Enterobacter mori TaxID=539813 RepID=UPI0025C7CF34|nr:hypothetical protein [Enterobacter mori]EME8859694.1 hypothetical protein [Enterobacter mori]